MYKLNTNQGFLLALIIMGSLIFYNFMFVTFLPEIAFVHNNSAISAESNFPSRIIGNLAQDGYYSGKNYSVSYITAADDVDSSFNALLETEKSNPKIVVTVGESLFKAGTEVIVHRPGRSYVFFNPQTKAYVLIDSEKKMSEYSLDGDASFEKLYDEASNEISKILAELVK